MAGSMFNPHDIIPNPLRPPRPQRRQVSPDANQRLGGSIDNDHLLYNLTGYQAPYLQNFEELPPQASHASFSPNLPNLQDDTYPQTLFNQEQQKAIEALVDVPDHVVMHQLALIRSDHESRSMCNSNRLATVPEASNSLFTNSTTRRTLPVEMPLPPRRRSSQRSGPLYRPSKASISSTNSSWSYEPSIFSQASHEPLTGNSSRHPSGDYSTQASVLAAKVLHPSKEPSGTDISENVATQGFPSLGYPEAPTNTAIENCPIPDHPNPPVNSQTSSNAIKFSCTLCDSKATFRGKSEWKRHELSHMPSVEYVCLPRGLIEEGSRCAICSAHNPGSQHILEHSAHLCLAKDIEARTWVRRDKFVKHLLSHGLSSDSPQVARWTRKLPNRLSGCGFCIRGFNDFNERSLHVAKHFESGCDRADWDHSKVILSLLSQPHTAMSWQSLLGERLGGQPSPRIAWSEEFAPGIRKRLEEGQDSGFNLALAAFQSSSLCQTAGHDQENSHQQTYGSSQELVYPAEHPSGMDIDTFMPEASQSWFDDSEPISDFTDVWGFT